MPAHIRCGVTLISQGTSAVLASAGLPDEVLDETLHSDGDGPCLAAIRDRDIVVCPDLDVGDRWPAWSRLAREHGIRGVLSYRFDVDRVTVGAINLYADRPDGLDGDVPIVAMLIADHASLLLRVRREQFPTDVGDDVVVQRAVGIVMAQRGCTPEQAL